MVLHHRYPDEDGFNNFVLPTLVRGSNNLCSSEVKAGVTGAATIVFSQCVRTEVVFTSKWDWIRWPTSHEHATIEIENRSYFAKTKSTHVHPQTIARALIPLDLRDALLSSSHARRLVSLVISRGDNPRTQVIFPEFVSLQSPSTADFS